MGLFGRKKKQQFLEKETECIFCGEHFKMKEVLYVLKLDGTSKLWQKTVKDEKHESFLKGFVTRGANNERKYLVCESWVEIAKKEEWTELHGIRNQTFVVDNVKFQNQPVVQNQAFDDDGMDDEATNEEIAPETMEITGNSTHVLCPHCHCALPNNFEQYRKVRVGLFGGRRSGKTSYMVASTLKMTTGLPGAVTVTVVTESQHMYESLREEAKDPAGIPQTDAGRVFPLAVLISPDAKDKEPFFLILQDIPGEYTQPDNIHHLANDNSFLNQEAFLAVVDVNMFVRTEMKKELEVKEAEIERIKNEIIAGAASEEEKEKIKEEIDKLVKGDKSNTDDNRINEIKRLSDECKGIKERICVTAFGDIYANFGFAQYCQQLKSVQILFSKIDQWVAVAEESLKQNLLAGIAANHEQNYARNNRINPRTLRNTSANVETVLSRRDVAAPNQNPMGHIIELFAQNGIRIQNNAYCAVACPPGPRFEGDCLNVLEPIMNICVWEDLLPTVENEGGGKKKRNR